MIKSQILFQNSILENLRGKVVTFKYNNEDGIKAKKRSLLI